MITAITISQGHPECLIETVNTWLPEVDEVIIGDVMIRHQDRSRYVNHFENEPKIKAVLLDFNTLFKQGFATTFNQLAAKASNDLVVFFGVGNVLECPIKAPSVKTHNCFGYRRNDGFLCHTFYKRSELTFRYSIHEELEGDVRFDNNPHFHIGDIAKDQHAIYEDVKEIVYFEQYRKILDGEGTTHPGWVNFCKRNEAAIRDVLKSKGRRYEAFAYGDLEGYLKQVRYIRPITHDLKYS